MTEIDERFGHARGALRPGAGVENQGEEVGPPISRLAPERFPPLQGALGGGHPHQPGTQRGEMPFVGQAELLEEARRAANDRPRRSRQCGQYPLDEKRRQLCRRGGAPMVEQQVRI